MLKKITSALLLGAMLVFGANAASAQVIFDIGTSTGTDTLFTGIPGAIVFTVDANGAQVGALAFPFEINFSAGNIIGPLAAPGNVVPSAAATGAFESISWNAAYGNGTDPDTMLYGFVDFGGPNWNGSGEVFRINVTPSGEGCMTFDSILLPPANQLSAVDIDANTLDIEWLGLDKQICVITKPNVPPVITQCGNGPGKITGGALYSSQIVANDDLDNSPQPLSYYISGVSFNAAPVPVPAGMSIDASGLLTFSTTLADAGLWVVDVCVSDGVEADDACCSVTFEVGSETPYCLAFVDPGLSPTDEDPGDNVVNVIAGSIATICVDLQEKVGEQCLGGFDLLICYDNSMLTLIDVAVGDAIADWEFFTYRIVSTLPAKIRLVGIKDMNNSHPGTSVCNPEGHLACLRFKTTLDQTFACQKAPIRFCWEDCGDNTLSSEDGNILWIVGENAGGIIDVNGGQIYGLTPDPFGYNATVAGDCPEFKTEPVPFVCFHNGGIRIQCPGEIDDRGDINLNGLAYEIADAVLYSNYFISGSSVLDPINYQAQIAASDVNADGSPLTVADLVYLIRVITGDAQPIPDDYIGGLKVAAAVGTLDVVSAQKGQTVSVSTKSDQDLGAALFVFKYDETASIENVSVIGRASKMKADFKAENGELRVLVYNTERAKIAAGSGDILNVATLGTGKVELVSVEAASFMGGNLDATVAAKIIPTEFALKQNFPNPFNPSTSMALDLPEASDYKLSIYNIAGQLVKTYAGHSEAGTLTITWDGTSNVGGKVASGVYFYRAEAGKFNSTRKMVLMK